MNFHHHVVVRSDADISKIEARFYTLADKVRNYNSLTNNCNVYLFMSTGSQQVPISPLRSGKSPGTDRHYQANGAPDQSQTRIVRRHCPSPASPYRSTTSVHSPGANSPGSSPRSECAECCSETTDRCYSSPKPTAKCCRAASSLHHVAATDGRRQHEANSHEHEPCPTAAAAAAKSASRTAVTNSASDSSSASQRRHQPHCSDCAASATAAAKYAAAAECAAAITTRPAARPTAKGHPTREQPTRLNEDVPILHNDIRREVGGLFHPHLPLPHAQAERDTALRRGALQFYLQHSEGAHEAHWVREGPFHVCFIYF